MKKTIILITLFIIFLISCKVNTGPIVNTDGSVPTGGLKSVGPVIGTAYLWIQITPGTPSTITINFGDSTTAKTGGETITYDGTISNIAPTDGKNNTTYAFQTGTVTGTLEILDTRRAEISFTQNVSPYIKIMQAVCEIPPATP